MIYAQLGAGQRCLVRSWQLRIKDEIDLKRYSCRIEVMFADILNEVVID